MGKSATFLSSKEEALVVQAIKKAEKNTSGEIRVHLEDQVKGNVLMDRAIEVFNELEMYKTKARNGVLFYVATGSKQFAVIGDEGINKVVPNFFWQSTKDKVIDQFKQNNFTQGLIDGIQEAGNQLKTYFKYQDNNVDELSNEISKG